MALRLFDVRDIIQEGKTIIHYVPTELSVADIGTTFLSKHRHRYLVGLINNVKGQGTIASDYHQRLRQQGHDIVPGG